MQLRWSPMTVSVAVCWRIRSRPKVTLPNMSVIELHDHAVWRNDNAFVSALSPDAAWPIEPTLERAESSFVRSVNQGDR
jgi:hypothetical protein